MFEVIPTLSLVLICIGIILLIIEAFIPGFGVAGFSGLIAIIAAIIISAKSFVDGIFYTMIAVAALCLILVLFITYLSKGHMFSHLVLRESTSKSQGFSSSDNYERLRGLYGKAETTLRPAGRATINNQSYDVVTDGEFITGGEPIVVLRVNGSKIVVGMAPVEI